MSTANAPNPLQQQTLPTEPEPSERWYTPMIPFAKWAGITILFYLIGPVILHARAVQKNTAGPMWQAEKRWARINGSAFPSLLWYVPIIVFHAPLASFWSAIFITLAQWLHLPFLAWFGGTSIVPPLPSSILLRWLLSFPLAGLLAILMEMVKPQTTWETKRVLTQEEQMEVAAIAAAEERKKIKAASASSPGTAPAKKRKPRAPAKPKDEKTPDLPKADSLWGNIDWKTVPDTHPLKQAALQEAQGREAKRREDERNRWLAQQQASLKPTGSSPPIVDSTLASPTHPTSPPPEAEDDYNWDEGEGSIQA